jgi:hypothetical protein
MLYSIFVLDLAASVAAIDISFYSNQEGACYKGPWVTCMNRNPYSCCRVSDSDSGKFWATVGFHAVLKGWNIQGLGYKGPESCEGLSMQAQHSKGNGDFCLGHTGTSFISAESYFTNSKKKRAVGQKCERVSRLGLEDGSIYDIADMSDADLDELVWLMFRPYFK